MKWLGVISLVMAFLSIPISMVTGLGVILALLALLVSGASAFLGELKYAAIVLVITTINLFSLSVASSSWMNKQYESPYPYGAPPLNWPESKGADERKKEALYGFMKLVSLPYGVTLVCISIGVRRRKISGI